MRAYRSAAGRGWRWWREVRIWHDVRQALFGVVVLGVALVMGCSGWRGNVVARDALDLAARTLQQRARRSGGMTRAQVRRLLGDNIAQDRYQCMPAAAAVLAAPPARTPQRRIDGSMPHYGVFEGPLRYRVGSARRGRRDYVWQVSLNVGLTLPDGDETLVLPDCALRGRLTGPMRCEGVAYERAPGTEVCPASGHFEAAASRHNVRVLLAQWSREVAAYFNRDARFDHLPIRYRFHFFAVGDAAASRRPVDLVLTLHPNCARQPYFAGLRSGWSLPVLAHEMAHFLGLLDEYEPFSGVFSFYPKTPFEGSETSRMGLSMKPNTHFYPLHHYLVLRRYFCQQRAPDPFSQFMIR